jgi:hypothetical protein
MGMTEKLRLAVAPPEEPDDHDDLGASHAALSAVIHQELKRVASLFSESRQKVWTNQEVATRLEVLADTCFPMP